MGLGDVTDRPGGDVFGHAADALAAVTLIAHLSQDLLFARGVGEGPAFGDIMGQWLLAEDMLAIMDGADGGRGVVVIGRGHKDDVEILVALVEHLAVIVEDLGPGAVLYAVAHDIGDRLLIDIDQGDEFFLEGAAHAIAAHASRTDDGHP